MAEQLNIRDYKLIDFGLADLNDQIVRENAFEITDKEIPIIWSSRDYNLHHFCDKIMGHATLYKDDNAIYAKCYFYDDSISIYSSLIDLIQGMHPIVTDAVIENRIIQHGNIAAISPLIISFKSPMNYMEFIEEGC